MTTPVIRLDRSKPFSECRGDRTPDDPHYRVVYFQGSKVNGVTVNLPFDSAEVLVPDDGKTTPWTTQSFDGKVTSTIVHHPLYTDAMRALVAHKMKQLSAPAASAEPAELVVEDIGGGSNHDDVNFASWLRGETKYDWLVLQMAAKERFKKVYQSKKQMVEDLVIDERVIPESEVCPAFANLLPPRAA